MTRPALALLPLALLACDPASIGNSGPMAVDCSFYFEGVTTTLRFEDDSSDPLSYGDLRVSPRFFDDEFEGRSFAISVYTEDGVVSHSVLYQFDGDQHPRNEFAGDHGFTGLNAIDDPTTGEGLQYACFARKPSQPISGWEE